MSSSCTRVIKTSALPAHFSALLENGYKKTSRLHTSLETKGKLPRYHSDSSAKKTDALVPNTGIPPDILPR